MNVFGKFLKMCTLGIILMIISTSEISTIFADEIADGFVVDNPDKPLNENTVVDNPNRPLNENIVVDNPNKPLNKNTIVDNPDKPLDENTIVDNPDKPLDENTVVDNPDRPLDENTVVDNPDRPLDENTVVDNPNKLQEETQYNNLLYYYENILGRNANIAELKYWKMQENIIGLNAVIKRIIFSEEYIAKNTNNKEYINMLYKTVLKREADQAGFNYWVEILNTNQATREFVLNEFLSSNEFIKSGIH